MKLEEMSVVGIVEIDLDKNEMWIRLTQSQDGAENTREHFSPGSAIILLGRIVKYESADGYMDVDGDFKLPRDRLQLSPVVAISLEVAATKLNLHTEIARLITEIKDLHTEIDRLTSGGGRPPAVVL